MEMARKYCSVLDVRRCLVGDWVIGMFGWIYCRNMGASGSVPPFPLGVVLKSGVLSF